MKTLNNVIDKIITSILQVSIPTGRNNCTLWAQNKREGMKRGEGSAGNAWGGWEEEDV